MRTQKGPLKDIKSGYNPAATTVVVLVCIPSEKGYYEQRLDILKVCLASIIKHSDREFDLLVIDNGSLSEVTDFLIGLKKNGFIDHLILNQRNLGLSGALNIAFQSAPGKYIAFSNDDIFFHPNWLSAHLQILNSSPKVGLVSGQLISGPDSMEFIYKRAIENGFLAKNYTIPESWVDNFAASVGLSLEQFFSRPWARRNRKTYYVEKDRCKAYGGKTGYAHVFRKEILETLPSFPFKTGYLAGDSTDRQLAHAIRDAGYLWLCTYKKTTEHMGNQLEAQWIEKIKRYGLHQFFEKEKLMGQLKGLTLGSPNQKARNFKQRIEKSSRYKKLYRSFVNILGKST